MKFQDELTNKQYEQIQKQLKAHKHKDYETNITLADGYVLKNFSVNAGVYRPDKMISIYLSKWIFFNNGLYKGKTAIDMGCGTGIHGIIMALYGAKKVIFSDISENAIENTKGNIKKLNLEDKTQVYKGNLFENIKEKADVIVFNHPFFAGSPLEKLLVSQSMLSGKELIHRFLEDANRYLVKEGVIIMPYFHLAGKMNNPAIQAPKHGYNVEERFSIASKAGLQKGRISIYEVRL